MLKMKKTSSFEDKDTDQDSTSSSSRAGLHHKYDSLIHFSHFSFLIGDSSRSNEPGEALQSSRTNIQRLLSSALNWEGEEDRP